MSVTMVNQEFTHTYAKPLRSGQLFLIRLNHSWDLMVLDRRRNECNPGTEEKEADDLFIWTAKVYKWSGQGSKRNSWKRKGREETKREKTKKQGEKAKEEKTNREREAGVMSVEFVPRGNHSSNDDNLFSG